MFNSLDNNLVMLKGAYKKLKSYYYYDKSILFIKKKIAYFESSEENFNNTFYNIAMNLKLENTEYFKSLIREIDFVVLPKKLTSSPCTTDVVRSNVDHGKNISKLNFFIDPPIELLILDTLWMLLIGKIQADNKCRSSNSYASQFKKSVFNSGYDLFTGIDFSSNRCFEPYFKNYVAWSDNAFSVIEKAQHDSDLVLMTLDLQSFYFSVDFDFKSLSSILNDDPRINHFLFLSRVINAVYSHYTSLIKKYKKGISNRKNAVFPIGLLSPMVLREAYMKSFDESVVYSINPLYYARYVDDILLVMPASGLGNFSKSEFIDHFLVSNRIVSPYGKNGYKLLLHPAIKLQSKKIECFFFSKGTSNILLNIYKEQIKSNSSEANLLPDIDILDTSFNKNAYALLSESRSKKIRDLRFLCSDNYSATRFVNSLKRILKNTVIDSSVIGSFLDEILEFYSGSQAIEFSNNWRSVFELFTLCHDSIRANRFYINTKNYIKKLTFELLEDDEIYAQSYKKLLHQTKKNLMTSLDIAISLATSLDYSMGRNEALKIDAELFRKSNILNHQLVSIPLANYVTALSQDIQSLIDIDEILKRIAEQKWINNFILDNFKTEFSPRFIHIEELYFALFIFDYSSKTKRYLNFHPALANRFCKINHLGEWANLPVFFQKQISRESSLPSFIQLQTNRKVASKPRIAVVSTPVSASDALMAIKAPSQCLTLEKKKGCIIFLIRQKRSIHNIYHFQSFICR